jgi:hypothetical protein
MDALIESFATGSFDGLKPIVRHLGQDLDHLPVAIIAALQLAPFSLRRSAGHGGRQDPVLEGCAVPQGAWFARQNRDIVPRVTSRLASSKGASVIPDGHPVLSDHDPLRIGMDIDGPPACRGEDRVSVPQGIDPPDQFLIFVTCRPFSQTEAGVQGRSSWRHWSAPNGRRLDQIVAAHLQEAAVVWPRLAREDRLHHRLRSAGNRSTGSIAWPPHCRRCPACRHP